VPTSTDNFPRINTCMCNSPSTSNITSRSPHNNTRTPTRGPARKATTGGTCSIRKSCAYDRSPRATRGVETKRSEEGVAQDDEEWRGGPMRKYGQGKYWGTQQLTHGGTDRSTGTTSNIETTGRSVRFGLGERGKRRGRSHSGRTRNKTR
jgi:hypothetical protein